MADERELYLRSLQKESEKKITTPAVSELALAARSDYRFTEKYEQQYQVVPTHTLQEARNLLSLMSRDDLMRKSTSGSVGISSYLMQEEAGFRTKEESYKEKEADQEQAAMQRSGDLQMDVPDIPELQDSLKEIRQQLKGMKGKDAMSTGESEYLRAYADVVDDLISSLKKAQKSDSKENAAHLVLAKEKYLFYTQKDSKRRLIGREQANALMDSRQARRQIEAGQTPVDLSDLLSRVASARDRFVDSKGKDNEQGKAVKQALAEYRTYMTDISRLQSTAAYLRSRMEEMGRSDEEQLKPLRDYILSIDSEVSIKRFHAEAANQCIEYLLGDGTQGDDSQLFLYAGHIRKHFGIDIPGFDENKQLRDQKIAQRIGVENNRIFSVMSDHNVPSEVRAQMREASTGYEMQELYEKHADSVLTESRTHAAEALSDLRRDHADQADLLSSPVFADYASLTRSLPYLGNEDPTSGSILSFTKPELEPPQSRQAMAGHLDRVLTIKDTTKNPQEVRQAILGELGTIRTAFNDISAFMVGRAGTTLLAERTGSAVFGGTAGLPTFKTKVKTLRDLIGSILERKDALLEMQLDHLDESERKNVDPDTVTDTLQKELIEKWNTLDQASAFIDYREEMIQRSYDMSPAEFARLAPALSVPDYGHFKTFRTTEWTVITPKEYFEHARDKQRSIMRQIVESGDIEKAATGMSERRRAREEAERAKAEEERRKREWEKQRAANWDAALKKLTEDERHFVQKMEFYESGAFKSVEERRESIRRTVLIVSRQSDLSAANTTLETWIRESHNKTLSLESQRQEALERRSTLETLRDNLQAALSDQQAQKTDKKSKKSRKSGPQASLEEAERELKTLADRIANLSYMLQAEEHQRSKHAEQIAKNESEMAEIEQRVNEVTEELLAQLKEPSPLPGLSGFMKKPARKQHHRSAKAKEDGAAGQKQEIPDPAFEAFTSKRSMQKTSE